MYVRSKSKRCQTKNTKIQIPKKSTATKYLYFIPPHFCSAMTVLHIPCIISFVQGAHVRAHACPNMIGRCTPAKQPPAPHYCLPFTRLLTPLRARRASARSNRQPGRHLYFGRRRIIRPPLVSTGGRAHGAGLTFTGAFSPSRSPPSLKFQALFCFERDVSPRARASRS